MGVAAFVAYAFWQRPRTNSAVNLVESPFAPTGGADTDQFGYLPKGSTTTTQSHWAQVNLDGRESFFNPVILSDGSRANGIPYDGMALIAPWGIFDQSDLPQGQYYTKVQGNVYPKVWEPTPKPSSLTGRQAIVDATGINDPLMCNPWSYPYCNMTATKTHAIDYAVWTKPEERINWMERWSTGVQKSAASYSQGDYAYLHETNNLAPQDINPCWGTDGLVARALPALAGGAMMIFINLVGEGLVPVALEALPRFLLTAVPGVGVYYIFEYDLQRSLWGPNDQQADKTLDNAATVISGGGGALGGAIVGQVLSEGGSEFLPWVGAAGGGFLGYWVLQSPVRRFIAVNTFVGSIFVKTLNAVTSTVGGVLCSVDKALIPHRNLCVNPDVNPYARRWDAAAVAAMITDEVCEEQGWQRSDPRAEFVFRGLMTGWHMAYAFGDHSNAKIGYLGWNGSSQGTDDKGPGTGQNPMGEVDPYWIVGQPDARWQNKQYYHYVADTLNVNACMPWDQLGAAVPSWDAWKKSMKEALVDTVTQDPSALQKQDHIFDFNSSDPKDRVTKAGYPMPPPITFDPSNASTLLSDMWWMAHPNQIPKDGKKGPVPSDELQQWIMQVVQFNMAAWGPRMKWALGFVIDGKNKEVPVPFAQCVVDNWGDVPKALECYSSTHLPPPIGIKFDPSNAATFISDWYHRAAKNPVANPTEWDLAFFLRNERLSPVVPKEMETVYQVVLDNSNKQVSKDYVACLQRAQNNYVVVGCFQRFYGAQIPPPIDVQFPSTKLDPWLPTPTPITPSLPPPIDIEYPSTRLNPWLPTPTPVVPSLPGPIDIEYPITKLDPPKKTNPGAADFFSKWCESTGAGISTCSDTTGLENFLVGQLITDPSSKGKMAQGFSYVMDGSNIEVPKSFAQCVEKANYNGMDAIGCEQG